MKRKRKLVSGLLVLSMMTTMAPAAVWANEPGFITSQTAAQSVASADELSKAVSDAADSTETVIQLSTAIELSDTLTIPENKVIVLDLNGQTLSIKGGKTAIINNGTLTVKNGTLHAFVSNNQGVAINNTKSLTIDQDDEKETKIIGGRTSIENASGGNVIVNNGIIESTTRNAYWGAQQSTLTVNDGTFSSPSGSSGYGRAISSEGDVNIYGGIFSSEGSSGAGDNYMNAIGLFNGATLIVEPKDGKEVVVTSKTDYAVTSYNNAKLRIYGGNFNCEGDRVEVMELQNSADDNIILYGGSFKHQPNNKYLAKNHIIIDDNGRYKVQEVSPTNETVTTYNDLKALLNGEAAAPKNITVAADITIPAGERLTVKKVYSLTVAQGHTLTVDGILSLQDKMVNNGTLNVTDKGFLEYPLNLTNNGTIIDYPTVGADGICKVSTPMQLQWLSNMVEQGKTPEKIQLTQDIAMPDVMFTPIGKTVFYSSSTFDGLNHTVTNLQLVINEKYYGGFFGNVENATIKNLTISGKSTNSTSSYIGALAGFLKDDCTVENVHIKDYTVSSPISYGVGGFAGKIYGSDNTKHCEFIGCTAENITITGYANVGGFWGTSTGTKGHVDIYNCSLNGTLNTINVNGAVAGGYGAGAILTVIGLNHDDFDVTVKGQENNKLLGYSETTTTDQQDKKAVKDDGKWQAVEQGTAIQAMIDGTPYTTLDKAIADAEEGDTVTLLSDLTLDQDITIPADVTLYVPENVTLIVPEGTTLEGEVGAGLDVGGNVQGMDGVSSGNRYEWNDDTLDIMASSISLNPTTLSLNQNSTATIVATVGPEDAKNHKVIWSSNNEQVATVNEDGVVTAVSEGVARITANVDGVSASCTVTVTKDTSTGGGTVVKRYDVTLADTDNGTITATHKRASKNSTVTITATPDEGYVVDAMTVIEKDGDKVDVTKKDDNKYTFKMPASDVTVKATFKVAPTEPEQPSGLPFTDVAKDAWYFPAVEYVFNNGLMNGTTATTFAPNVNLNRAMMAAVLYNMEGKPVCDKSGLFSDVADGKWYTDAVNWAASNNIVSGMPDGTYAPNQALTREQMASILYRYAEYKGIKTDARADLGKFTDGNTTSAWATDVVQWAVAEKLINGVGTELQPKGTASRAQVATVLMNYCENVAK